MLFERTCATCGSHGLHCYNPPNGRFIMPCDCGVVTREAHKRGYPWPVLGADGVAVARDWLMERGLWPEPEKG